MPDTPPDDALPMRYHLIQSCPDCSGKGSRILTDDGTRPPCARCGGLGLVKVFPGEQVGGRADG